MDPYSFIRRINRRRHGDHITERATIECTVCDDYELTVRYAGDPDAGGVGTALSDDADITVCPVCGAPTTVTVE